MTKYELSSFIFVPLGLWGEATEFRDFSTSDTVFASFRVTEHVQFLLLLWSLQTSAFPMVWACSTIVQWSIPVMQ